MYTKIPEKPFTPTNIPMLGSKEIKKYVQNSTDFAIRRERRLPNLHENKIIK